jgi:hypothetical protein
MTAHHHCQRWRRRYVKLPYPNFYGIVKSIINHHSHKLLKKVDIYLMLLHATTDNKVDIFGGQVNFVLH